MVGGEGRACVWKSSAASRSTFGSSGLIGIPACSREPVISESNESNVLEPAENIAA